MVDWVLGSGLGGIHDPGFGLGAFFDAASGRPCARFTGSEVDPRIIRFWKRAVPEREVAIFEEDYLLSWGRAHENIVCNPPYMRFQRFLNRKKVFDAFHRHLQLRLSGHTNSASAFLLKSLSELRASGRLAYIMPLEFLNTGYGAIVKERLIAGRHLAAVIRLDCEKEVFPDVTTSVGIILYDSSRRHSRLSFHTVRSIDALAPALERRPDAELAYRDLDPGRKWLPYFERAAPSIDSTRTVPLAHYGRFSRGIATGANHFFALRPSQAQKLGLPRSEAIPCITKSRQVRAAIFDDAHYATLHDGDAPVLLFKADGRRSRAASAYIRSGERRGLHTGFLTGHRNPWYRLERRRPAPLWAGVFTRGGEGGYKLIRNRSAALHLTCFHGFYPHLLCERYVDRLFLYLVSRVGQELIALSARVYGDALRKFEPNDLNAAPVPDVGVFDGLSDEDVDAALAQVRRTGRVPERLESAFEALRTPARNPLARPRTGRSRDALRRRPGPAPRVTGT